MFSRRTGWSLAPNRLAAAIEERRRSGRELLDLTITNPTQVGLEYPSHEIAEALASAAAGPYEPDPRGDPAARDAVARWYAGRGLPADPDRIVLTPGTSESYGWLFKLLCDPGDRILVPRPSYPLFEFLAGLESVETEGYPLRYEGRWEIDRDAAAHAIGNPDGNIVAPVPDRKRRRHAPGRLESKDRPRSTLASGANRTGALVMVNPNNPTGSYLSRPELSFLTALASENGLPLVSDEVFSSYSLEETAHHDRVVSMIGHDGAPAFVLDGLSKSAGLPGMKVGWIVVLGPADFRHAALTRLELIADTYLSVSAPIQRALPRLIDLGRRVALRIQERIRANLAFLRSAAGEEPACEALRVEGGWSAVLRVPASVSEEAICLGLLERDGVLVQPGWFYDFESEAYLVVSLLAPEPVFAEGVRRVLARCR